MILISIKMRILVSQTASQSIDSIVVHDCVMADVLAIGLKVRGFKPN
jgi:hypothetical protein